MMRVYLIRHGLTAGNLSRRYIGRTDEPLCPAGITALKAAGTFPAIDQVYVSPMERARESAAILFPLALQQPWPGLQEMDFGCFENRSATQMEQDSAYRAWVDRGCMDACPGGEALSAFQQRCRTAFLSAIQQAAGQVSEKTVFVIHGGTIMSILSGFAIPKRDYFSWHCQNGGCWRACWNGMELSDCTYMGTAFHFN